MCARIVLLATAVLSWASALSLHPKKQGATAIPPTYNRLGEVTDRGTLIYTNGAEEIKRKKQSDIYTNGPRILGLDHCAKYREKVPERSRRWGVAGMPHTGTNALRYLMRNCKFSSLAQSQATRVPWKKHTFVNLSRPEHHSENTMAVVLVKDPVQWMASSCRKPYFVVHNVDGNSNCPSPVNSTHGAYFDNEHFESMVDIWGRWHREYFQNDVSPKQPALMIRFEDMLFQPEATIAQVCGCLGFESKSGEEFKILESIPKYGPGHGQATNRSEAIAYYTKDRDVVLNRLTEEDNSYIKRSLAKIGADAITDYFGYSL